MRQTPAGSPPGGVECIRPIIVEVCTELGRLAGACVVMIMVAREALALSEYGLFANRIFAF